jgi:8-oxo-dGTP pyrophosphatase MutT (NUDIX family)
VPLVDDDDPVVPTRIPRPDDAIAGRPAPWVGVPVARRSGLALDHLLAGLDAAGRGLAVAPPDPASELTGLAPEDAAGLRDSAVLVACFEEHGEARVILTRRSSELRRHRGEVAFPGGRIEAGEPALDAALREAHEEVGLDPALVTPSSWLTPIVTFASSSIIRPFVGALGARPSLRAEPGEVARVFDVAIAELVADGTFHEERWRRPTPRATEGDGRFPISFFEVAGEVIWGATARVLRELCCLAIGVEPR